MRLGFLRKRGRLETLGRSNGVAEVLDLTTRGLTMVEPEFEEWKELEKDIVQSLGKLKFE